MTGGVKAAVTKGRNSIHLFCLASTTFAIILWSERCQCSIFPLVEGQYAVVRRRVIPSSLHNSCHSSFGNSFPRSDRTQCGVPYFNTTSWTKALAALIAVLSRSGTAITKRVCDGSCLNRHIIHIYIHILKKSTKIKLPKKSINPQRSVQSTHTPSSPSRDH